MSLRALICEMFEKMVVAKDITRVDVYYHPAFMLYTNGQVQDLETFRRGHERIYPTAISYEIGYDEEAWVESGDRLAGRVWVTTKMPGEPPRRIEVVLIATYLDGLIHRVWELTWPDWSQQPEFAEYADKN